MMKAILIAFGVVLLIAYLEPIFEHVFNMGTIVGSIAGALLIVSSLFIDKISDENRLLIFLLIVLAAFCFCLLQGALCLDGKNTATCESVAIVLGCSVKGEIPSLTLQKRIDTAYLFLMENPNAVAILCGGQGKDEDITEAFCMKRELEHRGIAASRLYLEDKSTSTDQNIRYAVKIIEKHELSLRVAIITSEYHQKRACLLAKKYGLSPTTKSAKTKPTILPTFLLRELLGLAEEKLFK